MYTAYIDSENELFAEAPVLGRIDRIKRIRRGFYEFSSGCDIYPWLETAYTWADRYDEAYEGDERQLWVWD